jgi:hypothetical protein
LVQLPGLLSGFMLAGDFSNICGKANVAMTQIKVASGGALVLAIGIIAFFEGYQSKPYADPIEIPTVCYGHTGIDVRIGDRARTEEQCRALLNGLLPVSKTLG